MSVAHLVKPEPAAAAASDAERLVDQLANRIGGLGVERVDWAHHAPIVEPWNILVDSSGSKRQQGVPRDLAQLRLEVADLHRRNFVSGGVESEPGEIGDKVIRLTTARENHMHAACAQHGHPAADRVVGVESCHAAADGEWPRMHRVELAPQP